MYDTSKEFTLMDQQQNTDDNSLENNTASSSQDTSLEGGGTAEGGSAASGGSPGQKPNKPPNKLKQLWRKLNIYLLIFVLLMVIAAAAVAVLYLKGQSTEQPRKEATIKAKNLSPEALKQLASSSTTVGGPREVLNVKSNAVFSGTVLVRGQLQVAGSLSVGKKLSITNLQVSGNGSFGKLQTKGLNVQGNAGITGQLSVQNSLSVSGSGTFKGPVTTPQLRATTLQLSGPLKLTGHISAGGPSPSSGGGGALGAGGTSSVSGSDTAGTVNIRTGGGTHAGCLATVHFGHAFSGTPHVVITPVGSAASRVNYYIKRSSSSLQICTSNAAPSGASFAFDYHAFGN